MSDKPELDQIRRDHERFMQLLARMPEPSEAQKRAMAEANSPEGWERALKEVIADVIGAKRRRKRFWLEALLVAAAFIIGVLALVR